MINIDDLKDKVTEFLVKTKDQIEESSIYNTLREKYETLPAATQRGLIIFSVFFLLIILLSIPYSFISSSQQYVAEFEENRQLIRSLLKTRHLSGGPPLPQGLESQEIESKVKTSLAQAGLIETQIGRFEALPDGEPQSQLAPPVVQQQGLKIELKKLNLRQIIDLGYLLQTIDGSIKMTGLEILASTEDPHYFDTIFKLISYSVPQTLTKSDTPNNSRSGRARK